MNAVARYPNLFFYYFIVLDNVFDLLFQVNMTSVGGGGVRSDFPLEFLSLGGLLLVVRVSFSAIWGTLGLEILKFKFTKLFLCSADFDRVVLFLLLLLKTKLIFVNRNNMFI